MFSSSSENDFPELASDNRDDCDNRRSSVVTIGAIVTYVNAESDCLRSWITLALDS
jgi:hypothetical protein